MRTFHVTVPAGDAELAADRLWQLGVEAVGVDDLGDTVELWTAVGDTPHSVRRAVAALDVHWTWEVREVVEPAETWRDHVHPTWYDRHGVVVPAWQAAAFAGAAVADDVLVTLIEPASSFGLGDHPTTQLTLGLLSGHLRAERARRVLDVGCGSGVLGIVAAQSGVPRVRSIDVSAAAIEATVANAVLNGVADRVEADTAGIDTIAGPYDLVVANILAPVLIAMSAHLRRVLAPTGSLMISGVLDGAHDHVVNALAPLRVVDTRASDGWSAVMLRP